MEMLQFMCIGGRYGGTKFMCRKCLQGCVMLILKWTHCSEFLTDDSFKCQHPADRIPGNCFTRKMRHIWAIVLDHIV